MFRKKLPFCSTKDSLLEAFDPIPSTSKFWNLPLRGRAWCCNLVPPSSRKDAGSVAEEHPRIMPVHKTTHLRNPTELLKSCSPDPHPSVTPLLKIQLRYHFLQGVLFDLPWARLCCVFPIGFCSEHLLKLWILRIFALPIFREFIHPVTQLIVRQYLSRAY